MVYGSAGMFDSSATLIDSWDYWDIEDLLLTIATESLPGCRQALLDCFLRFFLLFLGCEYYKSGVTHWDGGMIHGGIVFA